MLKDYKIYILDFSSVLAGASFKGQFEDRLKKIVEFISKPESKIITFIDEIHTLIGSGNPEGGVDASNILKPALARGELRCIGATTVIEYKKYIERDPAFVTFLPKDGSTICVVGGAGSLSPANKEHI